MENIHGRPKGLFLHEKLHSTKRIRDSSFLQAWLDHRSYLFLIFLIISSIWYHSLSSLFFGFFIFVYYTPKNKNNNNKNIRICVMFRAFYYHRIRVRYISIFRFLDIILAFSNLDFSYSVIAMIIPYTSLVFILVNSQIISLKPCKCVCMCVSVRCMIKSVYDPAFSLLCRIIYFTNFYHLFSIHSLGCIV